ncbi:MAG: hypothetical protein ACYDBQ_06400 [Thermoplasmatota archaeon]
MGAPSEAYPRRLESILATVPSLGNVATIRRYLAERQANGIKVSTLLNEANSLRNLSVMLGARRLEETDKAAIIEFVNQSTRERVWRNADKAGKVTETRRRVGLSPATLAERKLVVKVFFKWLRGTDDYPPEVKFLSTRRPARDSIPTDQLLTASDVQALLQAHPEPREKALFAVLHESGMRASEICALNVGSVEFDQYGAILTLPKKAPGLKTGARRVRLLDGAPYLQAWYEAHPHKANPRATSGARTNFSIAAAL